jgi:hypothetical protein
MSDILDASMEREWSLNSGLCRKTNQSVQPAQEELETDFIPTIGSWAG